MVQKFSYKERREGDVAVVSPFGYLEGEGGKELKAHFDKCLQDGILKFVLDFSGTELISSPGVAALLDIASRIVDDFNGKLATYGLDKHHNSVLEMAGFFFLATQASDLQNSIVSVNE